MKTINKNITMTHRGPRVGSFEYQEAEIGVFSESKLLILEVQPVKMCVVLMQKATLKFERSLRKAREAPVWKLREAGGIG